MVRAWYMDDEEDDQRLEHHRQPPQFVSLEMLYKVTGVEYIKVDVSVECEQLDKIKVKKGITYEDQIVCSKDCLSDYEEKLKMFFQEHLHVDEEIRYIVDGSGYFDVRDSDDNWIRIEVVPGDMLIIPSGIYHRFTLDEKDFIQARRFFIGNPIWTPHNRPADDMAIRRDYLLKLAEIKNEKPAFEEKN